MLFDSGNEVRLGVVERDTQSPCRSSPGAQSGSTAVHQHVTKVDLTVRCWRNLRAWVKGGSLAFYARYLLKVAVWAGCAGKKDETENEFKIPAFSYIERDGKTA
jgi:hypothetical protein